MPLLKIANGFGSVDVRPGLSKKYKHVRGKRLQPLCRKLGIAFAQALVGFEERGRGGRFGYSPIFDGVVVSARSAPKLLQAVEDREARSAKRMPSTPEQRALARKRRQERDIKAFTENILARFPHCPDADEIARHSCQIGSGRVGRSSTADDPVYAAVVAHIRHCYTDYDELLTQSDSWDREDREWNRADARCQVRGRIDEMLYQWEMGESEAEEVVSILIHNT